MSERPFVCGIDTGGTFTDCVVVERGGRIWHAKAPSTPDDASRGFFDSLAAAADAVGIPAAELLARTERLVHGTTIATNMLVQRSGASVGLITTQGFADTLHVMRGVGRVTGLAAEDLLHVSRSSKPVPLVTKSMTAEVQERIDAAGNVVVAISDDDVEAAVDALLAAGAESFAIGFLWGFKNPVHELRAAEIVERKAGGRQVSVAHQVAPKVGEYERLAATAIDAYVAPKVVTYLRAVERKLAEAGFGGRFLVVHCAGGALTVQEIAAQPILSVASGPAAGVRGAVILGEAMGIANVIASDLGGTSFDVGLVEAGRPTARTTSIADQYEYFAPTLDIRSIGAGGGSIVWAHPESRTLRVGPQSAGAVPGPACYGRGGVEATLTDCNVVLGYLNPRHVLGGRMTLDAHAASEAVARVGASVGLDAVETATGAIRIVEAQMASLVRKVTVARGYDPRDFTLFVYGGAAGVHAQSFAAELGLNAVIVPLGPISSLFSALGAALANLLLVVEHSEVIREPFDAALLDAQRERLERIALARMESMGVAAADVSLELEADVRHVAQVHEVAVPLRRPDRIDAPGLVQLLEDFEERYEQYFGQGSAYREAGTEIITLRIRAVEMLDDLPLVAHAATSATHAPVVGGRAVYWPETGSFVESAVVDGDRLIPGMRIEGPAVVEATNATILVRPQQSGEVDSFGNLVLQATIDASVVGAPAVQNGGRE